MAATKPSSPAPATAVVRGGRVVFRARRPAALVIPLALVTEGAGIVCIVAGATIGWFIVAAPVLTLLVTGLLLRPALELTRDGLLQRQYPFSSLTRWEVIQQVGVVRAGNRIVLGYKLTRHTAAAAATGRGTAPGGRCSIRWRLLRGLAGRPAGGRIG